MAKWEVIAMGWDVWKPRNQQRPEGEWRQLHRDVEIAGLKYRADEVLDFVDGVIPADREGLDWEIELVRDPDNPHSKHGRALKIIGRWTHRTIRHRLFRANIITDTMREEHIGFIPSTFTELMGEAYGDFYDKVPLAAELSEMVIAHDAGESRRGLGVIIRLNILAPPKKDPIWQEINQAKNE